MRLSDFVSSADVDRAIAVTIDSFVASQKVSCKKALARAFAKYTLARPGAVRNRNGVGGSGRQGGPMGERSRAGGRTVGVRG